MNIPVGPDATNTFVTFTKPVGPTFVSAISSQGLCTNDAPGIGQISCNLGTVANGTTATIAITFTPVATGTFTLSGTYNSDLDIFDPDLLNNADSEPIDVDPPSPTPTNTPTNTPT